MMKAARVVGFLCMVVLGVTRVTEALQPKPPSTKTKSASVAAKEKKQQPWTLGNAVRGIVAGGVIGTYAAFSSFVAAPAQAAPQAEVVKINVDVPALIQVAKDNQDTLIDLAKQTAQTVQISRMPQNIYEFVRDAAAGDALLNINGIPLDVSISSQKGGIDVGVASDKGDLSLTVASQYIPKLPLLYKRYVLPEGYESSSDTKEVETGLTRLEQAASIDDRAPPTPLLDQEFFLNQDWTNKQVLGTASLTVGLAYGSTYAYHVSEQDKAEQEAKKKKEDMAAKRKAAAGNAKKPTKEKPQAAKASTDTKKDSAKTPDAKSDSKTVKDTKKTQAKDDAKAGAEKVAPPADNAFKVTKVVMSANSTSETDTPSEFTIPKSPKGDKKKRKRRFFGLFARKE